MLRNFAIGRCNADALEVSRDTILETILTKQVLYRRGAGICFASLPEALL